MRSKEMEKIGLWGIALIWALTISYGNAEVSSSEITDKSVFDKVRNESSLPETAIDTTLKKPLTTEEQTDDSQIAERRMSLSDFFFGNRNNNDNNNDRTSGIQNPTILPGQQPVQVHQNPNQLMFVRETSFPNPNGGLLSRLILARRMARLQRLSNRLQILPSMFGLFQRQQQGAQQRTLNQRIGGQYQPEYNPADIMLDGIGFKNASISPHRQYSQARFNQNFANDVSFAQNSNFYGNNQPYPQTQTSLEEFERHHGNFGLRQNFPLFDQQQQARQKENIYNPQQQQVLQNPQQQEVLQNQQQPLNNEQQLRQQQAAYDQNSQVQNQDKSLEHQVQMEQLQNHFDQQQQQLKYQQQLLEHQEQVRQQQQQLYEQQQKHLRQQQLSDQQKQQQEKQQVQQKQATPENYEQNVNQQLYDQQQLRLQQDLFEQQDQLKKILLDQQQKLKLQEERYHQLQKQVLQDKKEAAQQKINSQQAARDSSYYNEADRKAALSGNSGILDFGAPATYDVGVEINTDPFKSQLGAHGGHTYNSGGTVDGNVGSIDKAAYEQPVAVVQKPTPVVSSGWRLPLFPLGIFPRPLLNLNGKVFFGAELGKGGGVTAGD